MRANVFRGLDELVSLLNDHGEVLLGLPGPGTHHPIAEAAGPSAHPCTVAPGSAALVAAKAIASAAVGQRAATTKAAAKPQQGGRARKTKVSSGAKLKLELENLAKEHQNVCLQLQSLQLDNHRLRLKQALLQAINQAKQQVLDVLWRHRASTGSSNSSTCNDRTISALQELEQQVQQLLQASGSIVGASEDTNSSATNGTSGDTQRSWHTSSCNSSHLDVPSSEAAAAAPLQQQGAAQRAALPSSLQEQQQQGTQQDSKPPCDNHVQGAEQQQQHTKADYGDGWCPDPLQDPLWLLKRGMAHLDLSAAVAASRQERLATWQQVQGHLSLLLRAIEGGAGGVAPPPGGRSAAAARRQLKQLISSCAGHVISAHIVSPYEHMSWSVTNMEDMSQRHAPPEHYRHIIALLRLTAAQQQTIAQGLTVFHELLLSLKAEQTRLQQQLLQLQATHAPPGAPAGVACGLQEQQQLQALLARQDDLTWLQPGSAQMQELQLGAAAAAAAAAVDSPAAAADGASLLPPLAKPQQQQQQPLGRGLPGLAVQHELLQRVETNNWQLSWMIRLLNFFISGVLDLPQLCKCAVHSYPWPWWPGPFAEEVLHMYQQQQQQQLLNGQA